MAIKQELAKESLNLKLFTPVIPVIEEEIQPIWLKVYGGIAAGSPVECDVSTKKIKVAKKYPSDCYALRIFGKSMEPDIADGSFIVVKSWKDGLPKKGSVVVYSDGHGSSLKVFGYRKAKPDEHADDFGNVPILKSINPEFSGIQPMDGGHIEAVFVETV